MSDQSAGASEPVIERRPAGIDEGRALDLVVERTPQLTPVVLGVDDMDDDAFRASTARGGTAVLVADAPRETATSHRPRDPEAVIRFLVTLAHAEN